MHVHPSPLNIVDPARHDETPPYMNEVTSIVSKTYPILRS